MNLKITEESNLIYVELANDNKILAKPQDFIDLLGNAFYQGAEYIIINEANVSADFFRLKTQLAGEVLQKFSNYRMKLAIVGDFEKYSSKSLHDFIFESNRIGQIIFVSYTHQAIEKWVKMNGVDQSVTSANINEAVNSFARNIG